jgi:hypothetical protein
MTFAAAGIGENGLDITPDMAQGLIASLYPAPKEVEASGLHASKAFRREFLVSRLASSLPVLATQWR